MAARMISPPSEKAVGKMTSEASFQAWRRCCPEKDSLYPKNADRL